MFFFSFHLIFERLNLWLLQLQIFAWNWGRKKWTVQFESCLQFPLQLNITMCIFWPCNLLFHLSTSHMPGDPYSPVCRVTPFYISGLFNIMLCSCGQSYTHCILYHQNKKTWKSGEMTRTRSNWIQELENLIFAFFLHATVFSPKQYMSVTF